MRTLVFFLIGSGLVVVAACSSPPAGVGVVTVLEDAAVVVACGTSGASKCAVGEACSSPVMCLTGNCVSNRCATASCTDNKRDGDETGVDCGGSCAEKCDGEACTAPSTCKSRLCAGGKCAASGGKTCGLGTAALCINGAECGVSADCSSDVCTQNGLCEAAGADVHRDGARNAGETGVDCGGSVASTTLCSAGQGCKVSGDCEGVCPVGGGVCAAPTASDAKKNQGETDIDCGGSKAPSCAVGKICSSSVDCMLKHCAAGNVCAVPTATDGIKNGGETDVDCGGVAVVEGAQSYTAPRCDTAKVCGIDADCTSAVCGENKRCAEAPSCRPIHGGQTCGTGEYGVAGSVHESCCKSLPVAGMIMVQGGVTKQVYLDKYEITAGRIRAWLRDVRAKSSNHQLNIREWVQARIPSDPILSGYFSAPQVTGYCTAASAAGTCTASGQKDLPPSVRLLPAVDGSQYDQNADGSAYAFPVGVGVPTGPGTALPAGATTVTLDMGAFSQFGPQSYYRAVGYVGSSGCYMGAGVDAFGHRTVLLGPEETGGGTLESWNGEPVRSPAIQTTLDEKSANCMTPLLFAAFCAWDGGYVMTQDALTAAWGPQKWPWGASPDLPLSQATPRVRATAAEEAAFYGNFNINNSFSAAHKPKYSYPASASYASFADDLSSIIAAPGRMVRDAAVVSRASGDTWMDLGGNMLEWSIVPSDGIYRGWNGTSFEGHIYGLVSWGLNPLDKYGKGGTRCMRLK